MNRSYRKLRHIQESNQILENRNFNYKNLLFENSIMVGNRNVIINNDGTLSIDDKNKKSQKIKFSINLPTEMTLHIESFKEGVKEKLKGYFIKMENFESEKFLNQDQLNQIFTFVDSNDKNGVVESGSFFTPNLNMTKL